MMVMMMTMMIVTMMTMMMMKGGAHMVFSEHYEAILGGNWNLNDNDGDGQADDNEEQDDLAFCCRCFDNVVDGYDDAVEDDDDFDVDDDNEDDSDDGERKILSSISAFSMRLFQGRVIPVTYKLVLQWLQC